MRILYSNYFQIAGAGVDYEHTSFELEFSVGEQRECHEITIINDEFCELTAEDFFADLTLGTGDLIIIDPDVTQIVINEQESDCSKS